MSTQPKHGSKPSGRYRTFSGLAAASLVLGVLSLVTPFHWSLGIIPAAGIVLGCLALWRISKAPEELTGGGVALTGIGLSMALWVASCAWMIFRSLEEVPYGYQEVRYEDLQPEASEQIPQAAFELQDQRVFIRGYMMPGRRQTRLKRFILCPAVPGCKVCPSNPKPTEMIFVTLSSDMEAQYTTHLRRVGGKFLIDPAAPGGMPYQMEVDYFK